MVSFPINAQTIEDNFSKPWDLHCDTLSTQTEINICACNQSQIADSILEIKYSMLISYADSLIKSESLFVDDSTTYFHSQNLEYLKNQREAIINSRQNFLLMSRNIIDIVDYKQRGGSMNPMIVCYYSLLVTVSQIKILDELLEEFENY